MASAEAARKEKKWFPLESNPDVMNAYCAKLGMRLDAARFSDILATEDWALDMGPKPVQAVLLVRCARSRVPYLCLFQPSRAAFSNQGSE